jgi:hypothetical protein
MCPRSNSCSTSPNYRSHLAGTLTASFVFVQELPVSTFANRSPYDVHRLPVARRTLCSTRQKKRH